LAYAVSVRRYLSHFPAKKFLQTRSPVFILTWEISTEGEKSLLPTFHMIVYTDLRSGNYVKTFHNGKKKLLCLSLDDLFKIKDGALDVFPVPIAGEWLVKFGFSHNETFVHFNLHPVYVIQEKDHWYFMKHAMKINEHPILYIHQLQNFFYAFTGEELIVK
jgi:hypothetical protein